MFGLSSLKLFLIAGGVIALIAAGWKVNGWRNDAAKLDAVEAQVEQYREDLKEAERKRAVDEQEAKDLAIEITDIRRQRDIALDELSLRPTLTRTITKVIPDDTPCSCDALGTDFRVRFNGALDPTRGSGETAPD